jgi:hypothetical protein
LQQYQDADSRQHRQPVQAHGDVPTQQTPRQYRLQQQVWRDRLIWMLLRLLLVPALLLLVLV